MLLGRQVRPYKMIRKPLTKAHDHTPKVYNTPMCVFQHQQAINSSLRIMGPSQVTRGFPDSSVGKEYACNAGDPNSIPGSSRSAGEGIGYPFQYSWASLIAQLVQNPPALQDAWVQSLGWEDPLEKEKATHSSIMAWRIPWTV